MRVEKPSVWDTVFSHQGKTTAKPFQARLLRDYTVAIITAHVHYVAESGPLAQL